MDAILYARWSSDEQGKGSTLIRQREDCRAMAAAHGWNVIEEIVDDGISAFRGAHSEIGALGRFLRDAENGAYPNGVVLVVERLDRLSRQAPEIAFGTMLRMTGAGVIIATVDGNRQYRTGQFGMAEIIEVIVKAQLSYEESAKKSDRVGRAWKQKRSRLASGDRAILTRRAPAWLRVEGNPPTFAIDKERAAVVRRIFEMTLAGHGKHSIARTLNKDGVPTFGQASAWHASSVQKILTSEAVIGIYTPHTKPRGGKRLPAGDPIEGYYPEVIDPAVYAKTVAARRDRSRIRRGRSRRLTNLFAGLAVCHACRSRMTLRAKGRKQRADGTWVDEDYLVCDSYQRGTGCVHGFHWNLEVWGREILDLILEHAFEDRHFVPANVVTDLERAIAVTDQRIAATSAKADLALELALESGRDEPRAAWKRLAGEVDALGATLKTQRQELVRAKGIVSPEEHKARVAALRDAIDDPDEGIRLEARARIMQALGELIEVIEFHLEPRAVFLELRTGWATFVKESQIGAPVHPNYYED